MSTFIVTCDLDWAPECAIAETLAFFLEAGIRPTVFVTHVSKTVEQLQTKLDIGLHPYFACDSSHGASIQATLDTLRSFQYNLPAFRCHRFQSSNQSMQAMYTFGMRISSNVCTDFESIPPFVNRYGMIEFPIFMEDGGYLWRKHALGLTNLLRQQLQTPVCKVLLIHPMHFVLNSPDFAFMQHLKQACTRWEWSNMPADKLRTLRHTGRGIRNMVEEILNSACSFSTLRDEYNQVVQSERFRSLQDTSVHKPL